VQEKGNSSQLGGFGEGFVEDTTFDLEPRLRRISKKERRRGVCICRTPQRPDGIGACYTGVAATLPSTSHSSSI
jgi:hypothetical protein